MVLSIVSYDEGAWLFFYSGTVTSCGFLCCVTFLKL